MEPVRKPKEKKEVLLSLVFSVLFLILRIKIRLSILRLVVSSPQRLLRCELILEVLDMDATA